MKKFEFPDLTNQNNNSMLNTENYNNYINSPETLKRWDESPILYLDKSIIGPVDTYITTNIIDEITLNFQPDEEIYLIKGIMSTTNTMNTNKSLNYNSTKSSKIIKMCIYTTHGQFIEFGPSSNSNSNECNFTWDYHFNMKKFDGFLIGWNENNINYLASLIIDKSSTTSSNSGNSGNSSNTANSPINTVYKQTLIDTTYESRKFIIEPIFLTPKYGNINKNKFQSTNFIDTLNKLNIYNKVKEGEYHLSGITVYYDSYINGIEFEYSSSIGDSNFSNDKGEAKVISCYGYNTKKYKDKKNSLRITGDDCINFIAFTYDENGLRSFRLKTHKGKSITCVGQENAEFSKVSIYDNTQDRVISLLGMILGYNDVVCTLQIYYEKKFA